MNMKAQLIKILMVCALVAGGGALMWQYEHKWSDDAKKAEEIRKLKEQNEQLESFVSRLTTEKRVAECWSAASAKPARSLMKPP
jgi:flagellar basal body-associated protein FliL